MVDSGFVMSDIEAHSMKKPMELVNNLKKEGKNNKSKGTGGVGGGDGKVDYFVGIDEL